jgi:hypothetical protein
LENNFRGPSNEFGSQKGSTAEVVGQVLIERFGLSKNGGSVMNLINSIARSNPKYEGAIQRGMEILRQKNITL